jgi:hypothetical protein
MRQGHYIQQAKFLDTPIGFTRVNSISDVPHSLGLAFGQAIFTTFVAGPGLGSGVTDLNNRVLLGPAFTFLAAVDVSYAAPQARGIVNVALYREYFPGILFIFF